MRSKLATRNSRDRLAMILLSTEKFVRHRKFGIICEILLTIKTHTCSANLKDKIRSFGKTSTDVKQTFQYSSLSEQNKILKNWQQWDEDPALVSLQL